MSNRQNFKRRNQKLCQVIYLLWTNWKFMLRDRLPKLLGQKRQLNTDIEKNTQI